MRACLQTLRFIHGWTGFVLFFAVFLPTYLFGFVLGWVALMTSAAILGVRGTPRYQHAMTLWHALWSILYRWLFQACFLARIRVVKQFSGRVKGPLIVISNHLSFLDTLFFPGILFQVGITNVRYIVKESFKEHLLAYYTITMSWMEAGFPFVTRDKDQRDRDKAAIREAARAAREHGAVMLVFPEGTRYRAEIESPYRHLLPPKAGGFQVLCEEMGAPVVSMTQKWDSPIGRTLWDGWRSSGRTLDIGVEVFEPVDPQHAQTWLNQEWERKEKILARADS